MTFGVRRASSSAPSVSAPPHWPKPCSSSASGSNAKRPEQENPNRGRHATASSICNSATEDDIEAAKALLANPDIPVTQITHRLGVSPATLYRYIPAARTAHLPDTGISLP